MAGMSWSWPTHEYLNTQRRREDVIKVFSNIKELAHANHDSSRYSCRSVIPYMIDCHRLRVDSIARSTEPCRNGVPYVSVYATFHDVGWLGMNAIRYWPYHCLAVLWESVVIEPSNVKPLYTMCGVPEFHPVQVMQTLASPVTSDPNVLFAVPVDQIIISPSNDTRHASGTITLRVIVMSDRVNRCPDSTGRDWFSRAIGGGRRDKKHRVVRLSIGIYDYPDICMSSELLDTATTDWTRFLKGKPAQKAFSSPPVVDPTYFFCVILTMCP